ncbi:MAG: deoxyribodipyrimidine photo-lyase [Flavobacteriaceae bacterium]|nr:deoxyribodipyrimidine photo-lyase [Flavobacteriaceae bacterium]
MNKYTLFWFRRDLRLDDNAGLYNALSDNNKVIPIFIFDTNILNKLAVDDPRIKIIYDALEKINNKLKIYNTRIASFKGDPIEVFGFLIKKYSIEKVVFNHDYEPYANKRDLQIKFFLDTNKIKCTSYKDHVIFEKGEIVKKDGKPYKVYTPFSKVWIEKYNSQIEQKYSSENFLDKFVKDHSLPFLSFNKIGFSKTKIKLPKHKYNSSLVREYEAIRNFPAIDKTSRIGPYLRFGLLSVRKLVKVANTQSNKTFLKELIWREFFMQILWHFPNTIDNSFKPKYDRIEWRNDESEYKKWCIGQTGYPIVDAGMRELNNTGFMHNRIRMIVGSFLCKHLLIDWRWGEAYFAEKLLDYEQSSNIGNWQWVSGCGVDASPYFRVFNPYEQVKKFDKELFYIKKWVPEFQDLNYPSPMVDHKFARERCLSVFKTALKSDKI